MSFWEPKGLSLLYIKGQNPITWKILLYDTFEHSIEQGHFAFMILLLGFCHDIFGWY